MFASETSDPNFPHQDPIRPDLASETHIPDLPPDPLLDSGSFIHSPFTGVGTLTGLHRNKKMVETLGSRRSSFPAETSNGKKLPANVSGAGNEDSPAVKKCPSTRNVDASPRTVSSEKPDWLPPGWVVEDKVRSSGATAGTRDKYYFEPSSGRRFRSKIEVLYFLETGTLRKRKKTAESADSPDEQKSKKSPSSSKSKPKPKALNFDFSNVPEKVEWVLTEPSQETWTPSIDNEKVSDSTKRDWAAAFNHLCQSKASKKL